jgi:integrase
VGRAKLIDFHFHDRRHTFASWAVQRRATLQEVKDLLGHGSLAMTLRTWRPSTSAPLSPASTRPCLPTRR